MYYRLRSTHEQTFVYNIADTEPTKEYVLEILHFLPIKKKKTMNNKGKIYNCKENLQKCIDILCSNYEINIRDLENGRNIYCPFHENVKTSKSASSKLNLKSGYFTCFSSNCTIPINCKTGFRQLTANQLLKKLTQ